MHHPGSECWVRAAFVKPDPQFPVYILTLGEQKLETTGCVGTVWVTQKTLVGVSVRPSKFLARS